MSGRDPLAGLQEHAEAIRSQLRAFDRAQAAARAAATDEERRAGLANLQKIARKLHGAAEGLSAAAGVAVRHSNP